VSYGVTPPIGSLDGEAQTVYCGFARNGEAERDTTKKVTPISQPSHDDIFNKEIKRKEEK